MRPSRRNEGPTMVVVVVDKFCKSPLFDGGGQFIDDNEKLGGHNVVIEEASEKTTNDDIIAEGFYKKKQYLMKEQRPFANWWKNHILSQHDEERANVAISEDPLSWSEAIRYNMWKPMVLTI